MPQLCCTFCDFPHVEQDVAVTFVANGEEGNLVELHGAQPDMGRLLAQAAASCPSSTS